MAGGGFPGGGMGPGGYATNAYGPPAIMGGPMGAKPPMLAAGPGPSIESF